jgi:cytochrome P450
MITPAFRPNRVRELAQEARALAISLIEGFLPRGECEFIADFAQQLPIIVFLNMCELPLADRPRLMQWTNASLRPKDAASRDAARAAMSNYITGCLARRRANPGNDLLSYVLNAEINGRMLTEQEAHSTATSLLGGGLDTVASTMGWVAKFLAGSPAHRRQLIDQPELIPNAVQELLRRFSIANIARVVAHDMEYRGVQLKAGEQVLMQACLHGLDANSFANPLDVDFCRADARKHSAFSHGVHRCPGANLAEQELAIFIEEWLRRIPDFSIEPGAKVETATGIVHGVLSLPLVWPVH